LNSTISSVVVPLNHAIKLATKATARHSVKVGLALKRQAPP